MSAGKGDSPRNCFSHQFRENYSTINWNNPMKEKTADSHKWQRANVRKQAKRPKRESVQDLYDDIENGYQHFIQKRIRLTKKDMA